MCECDIGLQAKFEEAVDNGDLAAVATLIDAGAPVDYEYYWGYPIFTAVARRDHDMIRLLARKGANLDAISSERDWVPILHPIGPPPWESLETVKLLLELGASTEVRNRQHQTPLLVALWRKRSSSIARLLVEYGADPWARDNNRCNAIHYAVRFECNDVLDVIIRKYGKRAKAAVSRARKDFALIASAKANDSRAVREWLSKKANVNALDPHGTFALYQAATNGNIDILTSLLNAGAQVSLCGEGKKTALMAAALGGHREAVDLLLDAGASLLDEVIPGERLADGRDMDAVDFAREGRHKELYEYLRSLRKELRAARRKEERVAQRAKEELRGQGGTAGTKVKGKGGKAKRPARAARNRQSGKLPATPKRKKRATPQPKTESQRKVKRKKR